MAQKFLKYQDPAFLIILSMLPITYVVDSDGVVRAQLTPDKTAVTAKSLDEAS